MGARRGNRGRTIIDLATVRATLDYMREDLRLAPECARLAGHLDAAVAEIDLLEGGEERVVPLALIAQQFRRFGN
jgi:hypothetical protein